MSRIPSLDGSRAIAISLVVIGHWAEVRFQSDVAGSYASLGRRIFFVLSGYLITTLLMKEYGKTATIGLRKFYVRGLIGFCRRRSCSCCRVFVIFWRDLRWYHMAAAALYVVNFDFSHPWFLGHLWSLSVQEQFYFSWPCVLKKWRRHRVKIVLAVTAFAPLYRVACHLLQLHGRADETFPGGSGHPSDWMSAGLLRKDAALHSPGMGCVEDAACGAGARVCRTVAISHHAGAVVCALAVDAFLDHGIASARRAAAVLAAELASGGLAGKDQYSLYLGQQLFVFGERGKPLYFVLLALVMAAASYYLVEMPMLRVRERQTEKRRMWTNTLATAA